MNSFGIETWKIMPVSQLYFKIYITAQKGRSDVPVMRQPLPYKCDE